MCIFQRDIGNIHRVTKEEVSTCHHNFFTRARTKPKGRELLVTGPGPRLNAELRIKRRLRIGVSPMLTRPLHHLLQIAKCWSRSLLHPQGQPSAGIRGVLRADRFRSEFRSDPAPTPSIRRSPISRTPGSRTSWAEETGDSEDKIVFSPNMKWALTRLQNKALRGTSSLVGGLGIHWKERATPKKPQPS